MNDEYCDVCGEKLAPGFIEEIRINKEEWSVCSSCGDKVKVFVENLAD